MKRHWEKLAAKYDGLQRRERILVLVAALACVAALMNALLLEPLAARKKTLLAQIADDGRQMRQMQQQIQAMLQNSRVDPDAASKARLAEAQERLRAVDAELDAMRHALVAPDRMPQLLEGMLKRHGQLRLLSLKTLPAAGLAESGTAAASAGRDGKAAPVADDFPIFRHGVELTVEGRYLDLLDYLSALERLPWHMLWGKAALKAGDGGISTLTLTVYTLSLDKTWLSL